MNILRLWFHFRNFFPQRQEQLIDGKTAPSGPHLFFSLPVCPSLNIITILYINACKCICMQKCIVIQLPLILFPLIMYITTSVWWIYQSVIYPSLCSIQLDSSVHSDVVSLVYCKNKFVNSTMLIVIFIVSGNWEWIFSNYNFCMLSLFKSLQGTNAQTWKTVYANTNTIVIMFMLLTI